MNHLCNLPTQVNPFVRTIKQSAGTFLKGGFALLLFTASLTAFPQQNATIKEVKKQMKTYPFFDPNPVANAGSNIYPYFRFDGYSAKSVDREWTMVEMENDYIKVTVAPEIGGKVWGAIEKSTGNRFLYYNHVVKFRDIAMRGPWTSGGVEFNFGLIGHIPTTATPVDYTIQENKDGSVSCFVGALELMTDTRWMIEINLPKDKAYFTTRVLWENSSGMSQPFYNWSNAAYHDGDDMEMIFPGSAYIGHGGDAHSYPIDEKGRDLSWYRDNNFGDSKSYHVLGGYSDFYGAYMHSNDYGSVHYVPYEEKLGRKIFIWGLSQSGMIWEDLLTDNDGQYVEFQSGKLFSQPGSSSARTPFKHPSFPPYGLESWKEYWAPVKGTGGITLMNSLGTLNISDSGNKTIVAFCPLQQVNEPITVRVNNETVYSTTLKLDVLQTWKTELQLPESSLDDLVVEIGNRKLIYDAKAYNYQVERPLTLPADFDWNGAYGLYVQGEQWLNQNQYEQAEDCLSRSLEKEPWLLPALQKMGLLWLHHGDYQRSLHYCKKALQLDTYNSESNYLYAMNQLKLGNLLDAKEGFSLACYSIADKGAALIRLGQCFFLEGNMKKAEECWRESLCYNSKRVLPREWLSCLYRVCGQTDKAATLIEELLQEYPLNRMAAFERYLLTGKETDASAFRGTITNELPFETYIQLSDRYVELQLFQEAVKVLLLAPEHPLVDYHLAYLYHKLGEEEKSNFHLNRAENGSPFLVFPHRITTLTCLEWASKKIHSWKNNYYRALLYTHFGNKEKALQQLNGCDEADFAPLFVVRAKMKSGEERLQDLLTAEQLDPNDWRIGMELISFYQNANKPEKALTYAEKHFNRDKSNDKIGLRYAKLLSVCGEYDKSLSLLSKLIVLPSEGASEGRVVYRQAHLMKSIDCLKKGRHKTALNHLQQSMLWPENLGVGKPYDDFIDQHLEEYLQGIILLKMNKKEQAATYFEKVASRTAFARNSNLLLKALALKKMDKVAEADEVIRTWEENGDKSYVKEWCIGFYKNGVEWAKNHTSTHVVSNNEEVKPWEAAIQHDGNFAFILSLQEFL